MRCPVCVEKNMESTLHPGASFSTCMAGSSGYYDATGEWVPGFDPNITSTDYRCSRGHRFVERSQGGKVIGIDVTQRNEECIHWRDPATCETCRQPLPNASEA